MANAHKAPSGMEVGINEHIQVSKALDRTRHGSCNACTPFTQVAEYETVAEIQLRGLTFRLCPACAGKLKLAL